MKHAPLVLVCDDDRTIQSVVRTLLEAEGFRVLTAQNALEGVSLVRRERPVLILMDILMPDLDGTTASDLLREIPEFASIPVVLLSALPREEIVERMRETGAVAFLEKPFRRKQLLDVVGRWTHHSLSS
jgi:CheY-like chemotaxis protein